MPKKKHQHRDAALCKVTIEPGDAMLEDILKRFAGAMGRPDAYWTYRMDDEDGYPLYIGMTHRFMHRLSEHRANPAADGWRRCVERIEFQMWCCKEEARFREAWMIHVQQPIVNIAHNLGRCNGKPVSGCGICEWVAFGGTFDVSGTLTLTPATPAAGCEQ